ncbi:SRPBCC family protein [Streptomyces griseoluteus]|uniref:SRPBCC family protein n=1 Tax=Streptomyces griseoluteus TaxID=29306 RepID=UPI003691CB4F
MELQVFVPVPADRLREALADAVRVARAVPGLQQDAGAAPVAGRLKLRVGGHSVTYRGTLAVSPRADGTYAVRADGTESRGAGTVTLSLTLALAATGGGTTVTLGGTAKAEGRLAELPVDAVTTAANRLLTRTLETLAAGVTEGTGPARAEDASEPGRQGQGEATEPGRTAADTAAGPGQAEGDSAGPGRQAEAEPTADKPAPGRQAEAEPTADKPAPERRAEDEDDEPAPGRQAEAEPTDEKPGTPPPSGFDTEVPPPSLDPETDAAIPDTVPDDLEVRAEPPAEAAHARRTMIGRSAEEVDHAPPRGRYAPVPAPQTVTAHPALRWAAPAAAVAVAGAIVVARALRKRH